jgi:hypothetical protein
MRNKVACIPRLILCKERGIRDNLERTHEDRQRREVLSQTLQLQCPDILPYLSIHRAVFAVTRARCISIHIFIEDINTPWCCGAVVDYALGGGVNRTPRRVCYGVKSVETLTLVSAPSGHQWQHIVSSPCTQVNHETTI